MPAIVVPGVCRFAVHGTIHDRPWVNVFDVDLSEGRPAADADIVTKAQQLLDAYVAQIDPLVSNDWFTDSCSWVDLDSLNGTTGSINDTPTNNFPNPGTSSGEAVAGSVCVLAKKSVAGGRAARNGRTFFAGLSEASAAGQDLISTAVAGWNTALANLAGQVNAAAGGSTCQFGVVAQVAGQAAAFNPVTAYTVETRLATMRRRLRP